MQSGLQKTPAIAVVEQKREKYVPLNSKLKLVLESISDLAKTTNIVSINANVSAAKMHNSESRVFEQIAKEMRAISQRSLTEIQGLSNILKEVSELSEIINLAGRQRMLAQKTMKLVCLQRLSEQHDPQLDKELSETIGMFEESHKQLEQTRLNTDSINEHLSAAFNSWTGFNASLVQEDLSTTNELNNDLINSLQEIVSEYQALAG